MSQAKALCYELRLALGKHLKNSIEANIWGLTGPSLCVCLNLHISAGETDPQGAYQIKSGLLSSVM